MVTQAPPELDPEVKLPVIGDDFIVYLPVTEEHIRNGIPKRSDSCPIALAIKGYFGAEDADVDGLMASVHEDEAMDTGRSGYYRHDHGEWVRDFDDGKDVQPTVVQLERRKVYIRDNYS